METLTYKRETLVGVLKAKLEEREVEREEARAATAKKVADMGEAIASALAEHPQLVVVVASQIQDEMGLDPDADDFAKKMAEYYDYDEQGEYAPDAALRKQIRVLEQAADDVVEVNVHDEIYSYL